MLSRPILLRSLAELVGTLGYVTAITLTPISTASAILQATPLLVTLGAAVLFGEMVGWRRWSAIFIGFFGVLLIIRPGTDGFDHLSLITLVGVLGLAGRDLATRGVPKDTSSMQLSFLAFLTLVPASMILSLGCTNTVDCANADHLVAGDRGNDHHPPCLLRHCRCHACW